MTAIDFSGYGDAFNTSTGDALAYQQGTVSGTFYPPLLDTGDGLSGIANRDLTKNLLVYIPAAADPMVPEAAAIEKTRTVVHDYNSDPDYTAYYDDSDTYRRVQENKTAVSSHIVEQVAPVGSGSTAATYQSVYDHFLVDKQDFNAPMAYTFASGKRMWYQRMPSTYVSTTWSGDATPVRTTRGWEGVSLPFEAELVSTQTKGEITHFYNNSWDSRNSTSKKIGHEYWLRGYTGDATVDGDVVKATMAYPSSLEGDADKDYKNTFLWDYYYSYNGYDDLNGDDYQEVDDSHSYYRYAREYSKYARLRQGVPYIIGFPGEQYYEFDLSGTFRPLTAAATAPAKLDAQVISFVSADGVTVRVSDGETGSSGDGYAFKTNYLRQTFDAGTTGTYTLNGTGDSYAVIPASGDAVTVLPFRPYFTTATAGAHSNARAIVFSDETTDIGQDDKPKREPGTLRFYAGRHLVGVTSTLEHEADVQIHNLAGQVLTSFTIQPGETVETPIAISGVFIVRADQGRYSKKVTVR